jgi:hypothetical protein
MSQVNHYKAFTDTIYGFFNTSNKNTTELSSSTQDSETQMIRIVRVLCTQWAAHSSDRATKAVRNAYKTLYAH